MEGGEEYSKFAQMFMEDILKNGVVSDKSIENNNLKENIKEFCNKNKINFVDIRDLEKFEGVDLLPLVYNTLYKFVNNKPSEGYHILNVVNPYTSAKYHFQIYCNREDNIEKKEEVMSLEEIRYIMGCSYEDIITSLKKYCSLKEGEYKKLALWIIGTYFHKCFPTYPILYFNATKGSGKTRTTSLAVHLSKDGMIANNITESVLFRTTGTLAIDEFESISRKGSEALQELLNSCYKKGVKVRRMRKINSPQGEKQVVEEFDLYRPVIMANINGINNVLEDRSLVITLDKSYDPSIVKRFENWSLDIEVSNLKNRLSKLSESSVVSVVMLFLENVYRGWDDYITTKYTTTLHTLTTLTTPIFTNLGTTIPNLPTTYNKEWLDFYHKVDESGISGRNLEISMPFLILSFYLNDEIFSEVLEEMKKYNLDKREDEFIENLDNMVIDFVSQYPTNYFVNVKQLLREFREFINTDEEGINEKWFGRSLKRLNLIFEKKRQSSGVQYRLNIEKAQDKMRMLR